MANKSIIEYQIVYLCDNSLGDPKIMGKELSITENQLKAFLKSLLKKKLITYEDGWYETTKEGEDYLKKMGDTHGSIAPK